jgi:hypothetical protein
MILLVLQQGRQRQQCQERNDHHAVEKRHRPVPDYLANRHQRCVLESDVGRPTTLQHAKMNVEMVAQWRLAASAKVNACHHTAAIWWTVSASEVRPAFVAAPPLIMI